MKQWGNYLEIELINSTICIPNHKSLIAPVYPMTLHK